MNLSTAQLAALKSFVDGDSALTAIRLTGDYGMLLKALDASAVPAFIVYRTAITKAEIYGGQFDWVAIDDVTEPKWRVWVELFDNSDSSINPSLPNIRAAIAEVWKGNAAKLAVQSYVLGKCKRQSNVFEKLYAAGTGSDAAPATLGTDADGALIEGVIDLLTLVNLWR